jgi:predicted nicotinamide N-methyase
VQDQFATHTIDLARGELTLLQPAEAAEIPDDHEVAWAPLAPYWSVLWRSGVAVAREVSDLPLTGRRVVELGCGLGAPSLAAAAGGASVLATDRDPDALELIDRNAALNHLELETAVVEWSTADDLVARAPFDLVIATDVLYERQSVALLLDLLPRLAPRGLVADPGRPAADAFLEQARKRWTVETVERGVVAIHRIQFNGAESLAQ